jgi:predicted sulfurtransferase
MRTGRIRPESPQWGLFPAVFLLLLTLSCSPAEDVKDISAQSLRAILNSGAPLVVVDTRTDREFAQARIPGAMHIPEERFPVLEKYLPKDKGITIVFYCRGYG